MSSTTDRYDRSADSPRGEDPVAERVSPLIRWTIYRPVTVLVVFVALLVVGVMAYPRIDVQLMPAGISTGNISVWIPVPDGTPQEVMEEVTKPCEDRLRTIPGVREIYSSSGRDSCHVSVAYDPERDGDTIAADVRERLDRAKLNWPEGVDRYRIWRGRMDADMPIYIVAIGLDVEQDANGEDVVDLNEIFENTIQNRLLALDGVARIEFWGLVEKSVTIDLDNDRVSAHAVPVRDLIQRLTRDNQNVTGGKIRDGDREYLLRSVGRFEDFDQIRDYPVTTSLRIGDVADVRYYRALRNWYSRVNGRFSRVVVAHKDSMANTINVCDRIEGVLEELERDLPRRPGIRAVERMSFLNQGEIIAVSIGSLRESGAWGGLFAMAVLLLFFRRLRLTLLVTLSIPFSLLVTVVWIYFLGGSFNIMSLMGMSLGIGMLVDNSIVVVENIVRKLDAGLKPVPAAIEGLREVSLAVSLATLTTVVVFLPIMFMGDPRFKAIYQEVGGPLCVSVLASLLVALVFIPQGAIRFQHKRYRGAAAGEAADSATVADSGSRTPLAGALVGLGSRLNEATSRFLAWCLAHRFWAVVIFGVVLISPYCPPLSIFERIPKNLDMEQGQGRMSLEVSLPKNLTPLEANDIIDQIEKVFYDSDRPGVQREHGIRSVTSWFNSRGGGMNLFFEQGTRIKEEEFFNRVREDLPTIPGVDVQLRSEMFDTEDTRKRIRVFVRGIDLGTIEQLGALVQEELTDRGRYPELYDVHRMRDDESDEVRVSVRRELAQHYGIDAGSVANMVSWAIRGAMLPDYVTEERELPFWIRYQDADKENVEELDAIPVYRDDGTPVRLENLASYSIHPGPGRIRRMNGKMTIGFIAEADTDDFFALKERVERGLKRLPAPEGFEISMNRGGPRMSGDFSSMIFAGILAICLVFFVMGLLFESFILPFSVLLAIPNAFFGSIWALWVSGIPIDPVGVIGLVMLVGIVVNNAIVLVDTIKRQRQGGLERREAILEASRIRFRPIWMTALTTIFGLLPLVILPQRGEGIDYKSMAIVIIGGLTTSTFFTLFVVPLFYTLLDDLRRFGLTLLLRPGAVLERRSDGSPT